MLASPLMAGNDLATMTPETKAILMNKELIAINQDTLGRQATIYRDNGDYQIWVKTLTNNEKAVCLLNTSDEKKSVLVDFSLLASIRTFGRGFGGPGGMPGAPGAVPGGAPGAGAARPATAGAPATGAAPAAAGAAAPPAGFAGMGPRGGPAPKLEDYIVRDLWDHKDLVLKEASIYVDMPPHSVKVYRFIKK